MKITVIRIIAILLIIAGIGWYVYGITVNGDTPGQNLLRSIIICLAGVRILMKTIPRHSRHTLQEISASYTRELGNAFSDDTKKREKLLNAVLLYNNDKFTPALKILDSLWMDARTRDEYYAVGLFTALCQTDLGLNDAAIAAYLDTIQKGAVSSQLYSNLGMLYTKINEPEKAMEAYQKAIHLDDQNPYVHNNMANLLLNVKDYDLACEAATKAIRLKPALYQAWTTLSIVYAIAGNEAQKEHCFKKAVEFGQNEEALQKAIRHYVALSEMDE